METNSHVRVYIDTTDRRPIYLQIMDEIRRAVVLGTLQPQDPLPSVRQLAGDLRVNPNTVAQAYRELEREGAIYMRQGQGTFVANVDDKERRALVRLVAERALLDAHRNGVPTTELLDAIRDLAAAQATSPKETKR